MKYKKLINFFAKCFNSAYFYIISITFILVIIFYLLGYIPPIQILFFIISWIPSWVIPIFITYAINSKFLKIISIISGTLIMMGMLLLMSTSSSNNYYVIDNGIVIDKKDNILYVEINNKIVEIKKPFYVKKEIDDSIKVGHEINNDSKYYCVVDEEYALYIMAFSLYGIYAFVIFYWLVTIIKYFTKSKKKV